MDPQRDLETAPALTQLIACTVLNLAPARRSGPGQQVPRTHGRGIHQSPSAILCVRNILVSEEAGVGYALVMTPEVRAWLHDLRHRDRASAILVGQAIRMLLEAGPELGRPLADRIRHSRLSNLKELRPGSAGRSEIRICTYSTPGATRSCW